MDEALAWKRGHQVVPKLLWVFRFLTTTPSSWQVSSDWPGHCPSLPGFQLVHSLLCQSQHEALSDTSPSLRTAAFLKWPLSPTFVNRFHTDWAGNPRHPTSAVISHVVHPFSRQSWKSCWYLPCSDSCFPGELVSRVPICQGQSALGDFKLLHHW